MKYWLYTAVRAGFILLGLTLATSASAISIGTYNLSNHPDGLANPPPYGLRLDGLLTGSSSEIYTFDFNHANSAMTLTYDGSSIVIQGQAFGGQDAGTGYIGGTTAVWDIYFLYDAGVSQPGGEGGLNDVVVTANGSNLGTLSSSLGDFELADKASGGVSFYLGDEDGSGHRGFAGISGWGWLMHGTDCQTGTDCTNIPYSDWLFTATPIPAPASVWLFASAILGLALVKRKQADSKEEAAD